MNLSTFFFFIIIYFNQGWSSMPSSCIYYLTREHWNLTAGQIGLLGLITGLAWYCKILFGYLTSFVPIKGYPTKYYLIGAYLLLLLIYAYIIIFGLNLISLIVTGLIINFCLGMGDVGNDNKMVIAERDWNLKFSVQAVQWTSLSIAGLIVGLGGAWIADYFKPDIGYRVAYAIAGIVPLIILMYIIKNYQEEKVDKIETKEVFKEIWKVLKNKAFLFSLLFIVCYQLSPSFGTALMIKCREELHVSKMFLGYLDTIGTVLGIGGYLIYYKVATKIPLKNLLYFTVLFSALTNIFYLWIPNQWYLLAYSLIFGIFSGITSLTILTFFTKMIPKGAEGFLFAFIASVSNFSSRLSGCLGGWIYDGCGYNTTVIVSTILTLLCVFFIPKLKLENK